MVYFQPSERAQKLSVNFFDRLDNKLAESEQTGLPFINLSKGNPDLPTPEHIVASLKAAVDQPKNHAYPPFLGKENVRLAITEFYKKEYGVLLDPINEIAIFHGSHIGITGIPQVLLNPGDYMLITDPCYPIYYSSATLSQAKTFALPLEESNRFLPDYRCIPGDVLKKARLLMLNYPNNPTGALATKDFFRKTIDFAREHRLPVINDFAYASLGFDQNKPLSILQTKHAKSVAVEVYTLSKTYNMAGWRFGFAVGNASIIKAFNKFHTHAYSTVFGAVQDAAACALQSSQKCAINLLRIYQRRRDVLIDGLRRIGWKVASPPGTFFAWLRVPAGYDSQSFSELLFQKAHIVVAPGIGFGEKGDSFIRISLVNSEEVLAEAVKRIEALHLFK
ncbi:aminotransferase class I/II-fold pyridoxal phosphate-dependent enzyme [Sporolactobacillus kofuensis]|uniref:Aminotransferase class I/II-fold pyridoxal phosphate-dependent enzyme n=1 Tax=Sporolactobacillus kofuensis TaxID=269672 RepID=A0ABW1WCS7_9BACL|nr:aminotransferase class I/II-fold pyridoxal phosphate-dependent enzyme [Sporolactobacillus kofuensis]MCO7174846.1 aminotransferase class I/II-fold pyridoxal phosphate-dependent enzyme [Sporolactobacillus kofuensis]